MTIGSATTGSAWFLDGISRLQQQQADTQRALSSGYRVQDAADSPSQTTALVDLGSSLAHARTYQKNLVRVQAEASAADNAVGSGISLIERARTLAIQAGNATISPVDLRNIVAQVQDIQQQLVSLANTAVEGRYIFGGNQDQSPPYQYNAASATGADRLTTATSSRVIADTQGQPVFQGLTAQQIFDPADSTGAPSAGNAFAALGSLLNALTTGNGIAAALTSLQTVSSYLNQQQSRYGAAAQRLTDEQNNLASRITALETGVGSIRDTDTVRAAVDLTQESTNLSAALAAQAQIPRKSLFDYLG
jgi:flagellar hook-associated protein 3 FlgL